MKCILRILVIAVSIVSGLSGSLPSAWAEAPGVSESLSPYFLVTSESEATLDSLPLKSTRAEISISGVIADVRVVQEYQNTGAVPLEAKYVFPGSTQAAVYGMKMTIGERVRVAKIHRRKEAQQKYEAAKKAGQSASILKQHRPNVFHMSVANIMPGDTVVVELKYTELLIPTQGTYEFVYPTVVGPRYVSEKNLSSDDLDTSVHEDSNWTANPYLKAKQSPTYAFDLSLKIDAGIPIQELASPSHDVDILFLGKTSSEVYLKPSERNGGNRDFILRYNLQGKQVESGMLVYEGEEENFFLLMMQPPARVEKDSIPSREYIFVFDVSGSMYGFPLDTAKELFRNLAAGLRPTDYINVLLFAGSSSAFAEQSLPATAENVNLAIRFLESRHGGGGTELLPALERALALPEAEGISRSIVIVTDGYVSVEKRAFDLIQRNLGNANFFSFGIGAGVNRYLIEGMGRVGGGESFVVANEFEAPKTAKAFQTYISSPVLTDITVEFEGIDTYDVEPSTVPDLFAERPILVHGKWKGDLKGHVHVKGLLADRPYESVLRLEEVLRSEHASALRYLWARSKISRLSDYQLVSQDSDLKEQITKIGLKYNLLTKYTAFLAVDELVRNVSGDLASVKQALPLPQGVSNLAIGNASSENWVGSGVGGGIPAGPEPETFMLMVLAMLTLSTAFLLNWRKQLCKTQ